MKRLLFALALRALLLSPTPERQPMTACWSCGTPNEVFRTRCRNCQAWL